MPNQLCAWCTAKERYRYGLPYFVPRLGKGKSCTSNKRGEFAMRHYYQRGFLLPVAIFLLVILAGLGAYAVSLSTTQNATAQQDVQGARAYQMARSGVEWAAYQVLAPATANLGNCPASPASFNIDGFSVSVTCTRSADYFEHGADHTITMYDVTATATFGAAGSTGYVERQVQVTLSKCRGTDALTPYQCG